ncbi:hypothetical protein ABPG72_019256 [Tetrahymena utriculariae]
MKKNQDSQQLGILEYNKQEDNSQAVSENTIKKGQKQQKHSDTTESNDLGFKYSMISNEEEKISDTKQLYDEEQKIQFNQKNIQNLQKILNKTNQIEATQIEEAAQQDSKNQFFYLQNQHNSEKQQLNQKVIEVKSKENNNQVQIQTLNSNDDCEKILQESKNLQTNTKYLDLKTKAKEILKILNEQANNLSKKNPCEQKKSQVSNNQIIFNPHFSKEDKQIKQSDKQNDPLNQNSEKQSRVLNYDNIQSQKDFQNFNQFDQTQLVNQTSFEQSNKNNFSEKNCEVDQGQQNQQGQSALSQILLQAKHIKRHINNNQKYSDDFFEKIRIKLEEKHYEITNYIFSGGEADIFKCRNINSDSNDIFALRFVFYFTEETKQEIENEYQIFSSIKQKINLTSYKDKIVIPDENLIIILTDLYEKSLSDLIVQMTRQLSKDRIKCDELLLRFTGYLRYLNLQKRTLIKEIDKIQVILKYCQDQLQIINKDQDFIKEVYYSYSFMNLKLNIFQYDASFSQDTDLDDEDSLINIVCLNPKKEFLIALYCISYAYYIQSKYYQSVKIFRTCFEKCINHNEDFNFFMNLVNGIGSCYINLGLFQEAQDLYQATTIQLKEMVELPQQFILSQIYNNYAECLLRTGMPKEAEQLCDLSKKIFEENNNTNRFEYCQILNNIASYQNDQRKYKKALQNYKLCLSIKRNLLNSDIHLSIAITLNNIGTCYLELFQISQNKNIDDEIFNHLKSILEEQDMSTQTQLKIENINQLQTDFFKLAKENLQSSVDILKQIYYKKNNYYLSQFLNNLATLYSAKGEYVKSIKKLKKALKSKQEMQDPDQYQIAIATFNLSEIYLCMDNYEQAKQQCLKSIEILEQNGMNNDKMYPQVLNSYGKILEKLGSQEAIDYLIKAAKVKDKYIFDLKVKKHCDLDELDEYIKDVIEYSDKLDLNQIKSCHQQLDQFVEFLQEILSEFSLSKKVMNILNKNNDQKQERYPNIEKCFKLIQDFKMKAFLHQNFSF